MNVTRSDVVDLLSAIGGLIRFVIGLVLVATSSFTTDVGLIKTGVGLLLMHSAGGSK